MKPIKLPQFRKTAQVTLAIALLNAAHVDSVWANFANETTKLEIADQAIIKGIVKDQDANPLTAARSSMKPANRVRVQSLMVNSI